MDVVFLSRVQFALTSCFHYIYPPLSIGLGVMLVIMEGMYIKTKNPLYKQMTKFWIKVFALTFALGVATGLVQVFAFGNNWARYSRFVGDVFGSALGAEAIFAFFLEAGFLGIMLFGWEKVSPKIHYMSTIFVAAGAHFSAVWIVIANSWMQTPQGHKVVGTGAEARAVVTDFWAMIFNPSAMDRLVHVLLGCWLAGFFLVISICAYYLLKKKHLPFAKSSMKIALFAAGITLILQLISADSTARGVAKHQPIKLAAIEGVYKTEEYSPIYLFGWVDKKTQTVSGVSIPGALSLLTYHDIKTPVQGLDQYESNLWPNVNVVFQTYHLMITMWALMVLGVLLAFWRRKKLAKSKNVLWFLIMSVVFPQIANQMGWATAEIGRQPWIVQGLLKTSEGVSASITAGQVLGSIIMFSVIFTVLFTLFIYLLNHKIQEGPEIEDTEPLYRNQIKAIEGS